MAKNILITLFYADGLHGGVKYSAELGQYFQSLGYSVYVAGVVTSDFIREFFAQQNIKLVNVHNFPFDIHFDLVWAHHFPILPWLVRHGLQYGRVINSCISEFLPVEKPVFFVENIDLIVALTENLRDNLVANYNVPADKIVVLPNTAPDAFFAYEYTAPMNLQRVAIVSNHPPQEVLKARELLIARGLSVDMLGGDNPVNVTPAVLAKYDAVITIGKTVQYCLAMGVPVYNYDHFGGSGYITPENVAVESAANFSGRSFRMQKSAEQIVGEILSVYEYARYYAPKLAEYAEQNYKLSVRVGRVLDTLAQMPVAAHVQITNENRLMFDYCDFIIDGVAQNRGNPPKVKRSETPMARLWRHIKTMKF